jgi:hypothetical protein
VSAEQIKTTKKALSHTWTAEKLALQDRKSIETIKERALKHEVAALVEMCDHALASKPSSKKKSAKGTQTPKSTSDVVTGYHFVCERGRGVTDIDGGRFWSGSWVVAEINVRKSTEHGAYLALHEVKSEPYRQGKIIDYRRSPRDMVSEGETGAPPQVEEGIEFLIQETDDPYIWVGAGAGEKGYLWADKSGEEFAASAGGLST